MGKKRALKVFSSNLALTSYCWNFMVIFSCWMTKPDHGSNGKPHLLIPTVLSLGSWWNLSWWIHCFCLFAILWFRVFWASASVIEVAVVPRLRWLVILGLISLIFPYLLHCCPLWTVFKNFFLLIFIFERKTEHEWGRGRERGRHRIQSRLQALSCQHRARCRVQTHEPWGHDLSRSWTLNWLNHPGTPILFL